jgi:hypothetical protein
MRKLHVEVPILVIGGGNVETVAETGVVAVRSFLLPARLRRQTRADLSTTMQSWLEGSLSPDSSCNESWQS